METESFDVIRSKIELDHTFESFMDSANEFVARMQNLIRTRREKRQRWQLHNADNAQYNQKQ